jgi:hypothetical protein
VNRFGPSASTSAVRVVLQRPVRVGEGADVSMRVGVGTGAARIYLTHSLRVESDELIWMASLSATPYVRCVLGLGERSVCEERCVRRVLEKLCF